MKFAITDIFIGVTCVKAFLIDKLMYDLMRYNKFIYWCNVRQSFSNR